MLIAVISQVFNKLSSYHINSFSSSTADLNFDILQMRHKTAYHKAKQDSRCTNLFAYRNCIHTKYLFRLNFMTHQFCNYQSNHFKLFSSILSRNVINRFAVILSSLVKIKYSHCITKWIRKTRFGLFYLFLLSWLLSLPCQFMKVIFQANLKNLL